jgi:hypothetical protein
LAAIWLAMLTAESAGLALQVLTSIRGGSIHLG